MMKPFVSLTPYLKASGAVAGAVAAAQGFGTLGITSGIVEEAVAKAGVKVRGLKHYGALAADPTVGTGYAAPADGDRYWNTVLRAEMCYYGNLSKWLTVSMLAVPFGNNGAVNAGVYYAMGGGITFSATQGIVGLYNGTVVGLAFTRTDTTSATIEVMSSGSPIGEAAHSVVKFKTTLNADFVTDAVVGIRNKGGGATTTNLFGHIYYRWRA